MAVPTLYRMCAEALLFADALAAHDRQLSGYNFPKLLINCVTPVGRFESIDFADFVCNQDIRQLRVQLTRADALDTCRLDLHITDDNAVYVCTLSNLGYDALRLDLIEDIYTLQPFNEGYVFAAANQRVRNEDLAYSFSAFGQHRGMCAGRSSTAKAATLCRARLFDDHIGRQLNANLFSCHYPVSSHDCFAYSALHNNVPLLNTIPLLFYLCMSINEKDLPSLRLTCRTRVKRVNNVTICFYVYHNMLERRIGLAVLQSAFCGAYAHVNMLWNQDYMALGNFKVSDHSAPNVPYICSFNPCKCDYTNNVFVNKIKNFTL
jgi:hypothetical protein